MACLHSCQGMGTNQGQSPCCIELHAVHLSWIWLLCPPTAASCNFGMRYFQDPSRWPYALAGVCTLVWSFQNRLFSWNPRQLISTELETSSDPRILVLVLLADTAECASL